MEIDKLKEKIKKILNDNGVETVDSENVGWVPLGDEEALAVISGDQTFLVVINPYCDEDD